MGFKRVMVLLWPDILAGYVMFVMQTYLTSVWKLALTHAAAIVNISKGIGKALPFVFSVLVDSFLGDYRMLLLSSIAYTLGLGFLTMSTPPALAKFTNTCSDYKPECIGATQQLLFYIALPLIIIGTAGNIVSLVVFAKAQTNENPTDHQKHDETPANQFTPVNAMFAYVSNHQRHSFHIILLVLVPAVAVIALPYIKQWSIRFVVPAICSLVATLFFLSGKYENKEINGRQSLTSGFAIRMIPFWATFVICGVITSMGNTYFVEQAKNMNYKFFWMKAPITIHLFMYHSSKTMFTDLYNRVLEYFRLAGLKRYVPAFGIGMGILLSTFCFISAAKVENQRIHVIRNHGLIDKPDQEIPMSAFWLIFQYVLLAGHDSLIENSLAGFFIDETPATMKKYIVFVRQAISGLGTVGSILLVHGVGKLSERDGRSNWFQYTSNRSRLDNYYWVLVGLCGANLMWYVLFATGYFCFRRHSVL